MGGQSGIGPKKWNYNSVWNSRLTPQKILEKIFFPKKCTRGSNSRPCVPLLRVANSKPLSIFGASPCLVKMECTPALGRVYLKRRSLMQTPPKKAKKCLPQRGARSAPCKIPPRRGVFWPEGPKVGYHSGVKYLPFLGKKYPRVAPKKNDEPGFKKA